MSTPAQRAKVAEIKLAAVRAGWEQPTSTGSICGQVTVCGRNHPGDGGSQWTCTVDELGKILSMPLWVCDALGY